MTDHAELLPEGSRLVHIGHPKSGSTALQGALMRERGALDAHGVVYPGKNLRQPRAGWAVLGFGPPIGRPPVRDAAWSRLCEEVAAAGAYRVCVSNEDFAKADAGAVERIVEGLGGDRVHVVLVARRLDKFLPSSWQERVKARQVATFDSYLHNVLADPPSPWAVRNPYINDLPGMVERWVDVVGPERFTLIVGDEGDHTVVPRTFEQLLGLPDGMLTPDADRTNRGLSHNETEWLRAINSHFITDGISGETYHRLIQSGLLPHLKRVPRDSGDQSLPALPPWAVQRVAEIDAQRMTIAGRFPVQIVGDLENLRSSTVTNADGVESPTTMSVETAARGVHGVVTAATRHALRMEERHATELAGRPQGGLLTDATRRQLLRELRSRGHKISRKPKGRLLTDATGRELLRELRSRAARRLRRS